MNKLEEVTKELDRLREEKGQLTDEDYWALCRLALNARPHMPKDEIPRRIALLVSQLQSLEALTASEDLGDSDGDSIEVCVRLELTGVPRDQALAIRDELLDDARTVTARLKSRYDN